MDKDELLRMLNLKDSASTPDDTDLSQGSPEEPTQSLSPHVFNLDQWDIEQADDLLESAPALNDTEVDRDTIADFHAAFFLQDPKIENQCEDAFRQKFIETLLETPDYHALHTSTRSNTMASEMATISLTLQYDELQKVKEELEEAGQPMSGMDEQMAAIGATAAAVKDATQQVDDLDNTIKAFGCGKEDGTNNKADTASIAKLFKRVKNNSQLRRICELAGAYRRMAQAKQRMKTTHGYDDMVGVELAGDVGRLLPLELVLLADEDLELDALRRLVEKQSMCREYKGIEKKAKGPIIVCVDESGSMDGERLANAKAFALAMAWIARHQNRKCLLVGFGRDHEGHELLLKPNDWDEDELANWLEHNFAGGTGMKYPLSETTKTVFYWDAGNQADMIILTDAQVNIPAELVQSFNIWKLATKTRCIGLVLDAPAGQMGEVSDEVHLLKTISLEGDGIQRCLSI